MAKQNANNDTVIQGSVTENNLVNGVSNIVTPGQGGTIRLRKVPLIRPGETKIFQLIGLDKLKDPVNKGRFLVPGMINVPTRQFIIDLNGRRIEIRYTSGKRYNDKLELVDIYTEINLMRGVIYCTAHEPDLYEFLMRCNDNKDNPDRDERHPATFELYDEDKIKSDGYEKLMAEAEAFARFAAIEDFDKIEIFAKAMGVNTNQDAKSVKHDCLFKLRAEPFLIDLLDSAEVKVKALLVDAEAANVLAFARKEGLIVYTEPGGVKTPITTIPQSVQDWKEYFVTWLLQSDDGASIIQVIQAKIDAAQSR